MAKVLQPPSVEPEQGTAQVEEAMQQQTNAMPPVDEQVAAVVAPNATAAPTAEQGFTVKNPFMLLPSKVLYGEFTGQRPTPVEQQYDAGLLWKVLANSPTADPITRQLAKRLAGGD